MRAGGGPSTYGTFCRRSRTVSKSNASVSEYSSPSPTAGLKSYRARPTSWPPCAVSIAIRTSVSAESGSTTRRPCHSQRALLWRPRVSSGRDTPSQARQNSGNSIKQRRRGRASRQKCLGGSGGADQQDDRPIARETTARPLVATFRRDAFPRRSFVTSLRDVCQCYVYVVSTVPDTDSTPTPQPVRCTPAIPRASRPNTAREALGEHIYEPYMAA